MMPSTAIPARDTLVAVKQRGLWLLAAATLLCAAVSVCYAIQPDWLAPITLVPPWCWLMPAVVLTVGGVRRSSKRWRWAVLAVWVAYTVLFVEETRSLVRIGLSPADARTANRARGGGLRVISLNCHGNSRAVEETAAWKPDVVLLQESPGREEVGRLARVLFGAEGASLPGADTSILCRGTLEPCAAAAEAHFVHATATLPGGQRVEVISLRLSPPVFRLDFWMPGFWIDHHANRMRHREEVLRISEHLQTVPGSAAWIVGGDCNAPPGDGSLAPLRVCLEETFQHAGRGWGATGTNDLPLFRVDQVWVSRRFQAESVRAQKTAHSDHRMVVCDGLLLAE